MTTQSVMDENLIDQAAAWHQRLAADDADWTGFTIWLEADPRHRQAYDEIALSDRVTDEHADALRRLVPVIASDTTRRAYRPWLYCAVAAALAIAIGLPLANLARPDTIYATRDGETRTITLSGGTSVELAPASRLVARHGGATELKLATGEAYLTVKHDPSRSLTIRAGDYSIQDIGTKFAINRAGDTVVVSVSEGRVSIDSDDAASTTLAAGQQFIGASQGSRIGRIDASSAGSWRHGQLIYTEAPLGVVIADITRYSGVAVAVDPAILNRRFSGVLFVGDGSKLLPDLAALLAVSYRMDRGRAVLGDPPAN